MAASASVRMVWDQQAIRNIRLVPGVVAEVHRASEGIARYAAERAPKRTGAGAHSIEPREARGKAQSAVGAFDVSWDWQQNLYMAYQEYGTEFMPPKYFLYDAWAHYIHT